MRQVPALMRDYMTKSKKEIPFISEQGKRKNNRCL